MLASNLGIWMQQFAVGWLVVQIAIRDGGPALGGFYLGLTSLATALPSFGFGLFAGVYADRTDRRKLLLATRAASIVIALVLAATVIGERASIIVLMLLLAAAAAAYSFDAPCRQSILPNVVKPGDLFSAIGLTRAGMQGAHTAGPLLAGLLVAPVGVGGVLVAKSGLDALSVVAIRFMTPQRPHRGAGDISVVASLGYGFAYVRRDALIRWCFILQLAYAVLWQSYVQLLPAYAVEALQVGAVELSWLIAAGAAGAIVGAIFVAASAGLPRRGALMLGAIITSGVALMALALQTRLGFALPVLGFMGMLHQVVMGTQSVILQIATPDRLRGRVVGLQSVIFQTASPLGVFALGTLGTLIGISNAFLLSGLTVALIGVVSLARLRVIRDLPGGLDRSAADAQPPAVIPVS